MVGISSQIGAALKGPMFEKWSLDNVLATKRQRITFEKQGSMNKRRQSDGYDASTKTLWDMKHYDGTLVQDKKQAADYFEIINNGYKSIENLTATSANYLFPSVEGAQKNEWLSTIYGFSIYYVGKGNVLTQHL